MSKIRILPTETANRIAAGEVVERPASVVKELVENAIDAEARKIVIRIAHGGRKSIQVIDDGCGMDPDDAMLALEAHATSKIKEIFDIDRIQTLGFRGEALPSIAGVSRMLLQTRTREAAAGQQIVVDGGVIREVRECGCPPGTAVTVRNLFFNQPARRKFMRAAATEQGHVQEMVLLQAMARPNSGFELYFDDQLALRVPPGSDPATRMCMLLGRETGRAMIEVNYQEADMSVCGYVGRPGMTRASRREQRVFVNGRPATADTVYFAIRDAYHTLVMKGRYPPVMLFLELPPEEVDVNVHPTKREVRFRDARRVGQIVAAAIRRALRELTGEMTPKAFPSRTSGEGTPAAWQQNQPGPRPAATARPPVPDPAASLVNQDGKDGAPMEAAPETPTLSTPETTDPFAVDKSLGGSEEYGGGASPSVASRTLIRGLRVIGTLHNLYLVAEGDDGLVLIDHHAAHERVLYEKLLQQAGQETGASQSLLMPVTIEFSPSDAALLNKNLAAFLKLGFQVEPFGGGAFLIGGVPPQMPRENIEGMMRDLCEQLRTTGTTGVARLDQERIAQAACKHAVRAEDLLNEQQIRRLLADLAETEMPYTCPHGRPVMINLPQAEIEKRFGRRT